MGQETLVQKARKIRKAKARRDAGALNRRGRSGGVSGSCVKPFPRSSDETLRKQQAASAAAAAIAAHIRAARPGCSDERVLPAMEKKDMEKIADKKVIQAVQQAAAAGKKEADALRERSRPKPADLQQRVSINSRWPGSRPVTTRGPANSQTVTVECAATLTQPASLSPSSRGC